MKAFLKYTLAVIVGVYISAFILFLAAAGMIGSMLVLQETPVNLENHTFLALKLDGTLTERSEHTPFDKLLGSTFTNYGLDELVEAIDKAGQHPSVTGIYLQVGQFDAPLASLQELRTTLERFRKTGKPIIAYGDNYSQGAYYLASVSNRVVLNPVGSVDWKGLSVQPFFYKDFLQKLGVDIQVFRVGNYKSAVEPYLREDMSEENRLQYKALIESMWQQVASDVSRSRKIPTDSLNRFASEGIFFASAEEFLRTNLVDTLLYRDQVRNYLQQLTHSVEEKEAPRFISYQEMLRIPPPKNRKEENQIAIYYAYGEIDGITSAADGIRSEKVIQDLRTLQEDTPVKAVVLRINSPGGSAFGSEQLWKAVSDLNKVKPVVVSMGDYAASGGYYMSAPASAIVAQPTTLTGSIGIFGVIPCFEQTGKKLGIQADRVTTHPHSDLYSVTRPLSLSEERLMQKMLERGYDLFLTRCAEGRKMSKEKVNQVAQGRVWTGAKAKELNLVDQLGGISQALEIAAQKAKIKEYSLTKYPEEKSFFQSLLEEEPLLKLRHKLWGLIPGFALSERIEKEILNSADRFQPQMRVPYQLIVE